MSVPSKGVVVGVVSSDSSRTALAYAARQARLRDVPLTLVHAWEPLPLYGGEVVLSSDDVEQAEAGVLQAAADLLEELAPGLPHDSQLVRDRPRDALERASKGAGLLVLGRHGGSPAWLGSVVRHLMTAAHCPVVVVPAGAPLDRTSVVVGVDGSEVSTDALARAFAQASLTGGVLTVLLAVRPSFDAYLPSEELLEQIRERGRRFLAEALSGYAEQYPDVPVVRLVSLDAPFPALSQAARDAGLVVVGTHGHSALGRLALGSVSSSLLRGSPCPVEVVRPARQRGTGSRTTPVLTSVS